MMRALALSSSACSFLIAVACGGDGGGPAAPNDAGSTRSDDAARAPRDPGGRLAELRLTDGERTWRADGEAIDADVDLRSLPGHNAFWFAWSVFRPGTPLFGGSVVREASIVGDDECTVPCEDIIPGCPGRDCIPPLDSPRMVPVDDPSLDYLADGDLVMGVVTSEGPRAYPHNILWWHEVVNEEVGGEAFAITFCPLTGSGLRFDRTGFVEGMTVRVGVSGLLYNSNLVMWDRETETLWSQMRLEAVRGAVMGSGSPIQPVHEMTWAAWRELHPDTLVISSDTGHARDYTRYPYTRGGDYRTNDADTFRPTEPAPDGQFDNKDMVFGLTLPEGPKGYVWRALEEAVGARRGVVSDEVGGVPVAVVFDLDAYYVHAFARPGGAELSFAE